VRFAKEVRTKRRVLRTTGEALRFIESELLAEVRKQSRWTFAQALLVEGGRTEKTRDLNAASRQLLQALKIDRMVADTVA
jgi:hypothetical protein